MIVDDITFGINTLIKKSQEMMAKRKINCNRQMLGSIPTKINQIETTIGTPTVTIKNSTSTKKRQLTSQLITGIAALPTEKPVIGPFLLRLGIVE